MVHEANLPQMTAQMFLVESQYPLARWQRDYEHRYALKARSPTMPAIAEEDQQLGTSLFRALFPADQTREQLSNIFSLAQGIISITITIHDKELTNIPWEACAYPDWKQLKMKPPRQPITVIRSAPGTSQSWVMPPRLVMLVAGSSPYFRPAPNQLKEIRSIYEGMQSPGDSDVLGERCDLRVLDETTVELLENRLGELQPHILHLVSHGMSGGIELEDGHGQGTLVDGAQLTRMLQAVRPRPPLGLIMTTACMTMQYNSVDQQDSPGAHLVDFAPHVVGMQQSIGEAAVNTFVRKFYGSLALARPVIEAFVEAREEMVKVRRGSPEWIAPVLYQRARSDGPLFSPPQSLQGLIDQFVAVASTQYDALRRNANSTNAVKEIKQLLINLEDRLTEKASLRAALAERTVQLDLLDQIKTCTSRIEQSNLYLEQFQGLSAKDKIKLKFPDYVAETLAGLAELRKLLGEFSSSR